MSRFVLRRLLQLPPTLLVIVLLSFFVIRLAPGSPFVSERGVSPEVLEDLRAQYGFDEPMVKQMLLYVGNLIQGDLGMSAKYAERSVAEIILDGLPSTMTLGVLALLWATVLGSAAGILGGFVKTPGGIIWPLGWPFLGSAFRLLWLDRCWSWSFH